MILTLTRGNHIQFDFVTLCFTRPDVITVPHAVRNLRSRMSQLYKKMQVGSVLHTHVSIGQIWVCAGCGECETCKRVPEPERYAYDLFIFQKFIE